MEGFKKVLYGIAGFILLIVILNNLPIVVVGPGEAGVRFSRLSGISEKSLDEGYHFRMPIVETIYTLEIRVQKYQTVADSASKDLQSIESDIALNYHLDFDTVPWVFENIGLYYEERVIQPAIQESIKATTANFTAEELITKRPDVKTAVQEDLKSRLTKYNIVVDDFNIVNFSFSPEFNAAIEAKQTAEQQALKASKDLERIKIEAEQKITVAKAEAEAQRIQRETISKEILQLRAIEKWNGIMPLVAGGGSLPFINIPTAESK